MSLSKEQILDKWFREGVVQNIVKHYKGIDWEEAISIVYLSLCEKDEALIQHLYETNTYRFFIARMVSNQIKSYDSTLYRNTRISRVSDDITPYLNTFTDNTDNALHKLDSVLNEEDRMIVGMIVNADTLGEKKHMPGTALCEYYDCSWTKATKKFEKFRKKVKKYLEY